MPSTTQPSNKSFFILVTLTCLSLALSSFTILTSPKQEIIKAKQDIIKVKQDIIKAKQDIITKQDNIRFVKVEYLFNETFERINKKIQKEKPNLLKMASDTIDLINDRNPSEENKKKLAEYLDAGTLSEYEKIRTEVFYEVLFDAIKELCKEKKYDLILNLPEKSFYLLDSKQDITSAVLEKIENKLP